MTQMIEVNVAEATGAALDWMVAKACGEVLSSEAVQDGFILIGAGENGDPQREYRPSIDWSQCGPLIEKYQIAYLRDAEDYVAIISRMETEGFGSGSTHLIAACRSIVTAKLGDKVMVPVELIGGDL